MIPKGYKHTEEAREKIRLAHIGKPKPKHTVEWRKFMSEKMKGRYFSPETRLKLSLAAKRRITPEFRQEMRERAIKNFSATRGNRRGVKLSLESREKMRQTSIRLGLRPPCGIHSPFWKGGVTPENKKIRRSIEFRLWREAVFARDNWTCQECKKKGGILHPHHIKSFALFPELRFAIDNGQTLCIYCHKKTESYGVNTRYLYDRT